MGNRKKRFKIKVLLPMAAVFTLSVLVVSFISYRLLSRTVQSKTDTNLDIFTDRVLKQIEHLDIILDATKQTLNEKHIAIARSIANILDDVPEEGITTEELQRLAQPLDIIELNVVGSDGIMTGSNIPALIGFDYKAFESTNIYMALTTGALTEISEEPRQSVLADNIYGDVNHYTGVARKNGGFVQLGFNAGVIGRLQDEINIGQTIKETKLGDNGYGMVLQAGIITAHPHEAQLGRDVSDEDWYKAVSSGDGFAWVNIYGGEHFAGINGGKYYAGYKNKDGYTVVGLVPEGDYYREIRDLLIRSAIWLFFAVVIMVALIYLILNRLLNPVEHLVAGLGKIAEGNLTIRLEGRYDDEFGEIKDAVNNMAQSISNLFDEHKAEQEKIRSLERELTQKQISVMLSQIQPHFLYNSLNAIQELCATDPETARQAVIEFSGYLRGNLDSLAFTQPIAFERELSHVETYLALEKKRFQHKLQIKYDITVRNFTLPVLTLQPIVENAVRHGVTKRSKGGTVTISTAETKMAYTITVTDDGAGFDKGIKKGDGRTHVGIENVRSRLASMCGGALEIESTPGAGTTVIIIIPKGATAL